MSDQLSRIEQMLLEMKDQMDQRFDQMEKRFVELEQVVRDSAQDLLDNQVEAVNIHDLQESRISSLEAATFRLERVVFKKT